MKTVSARQLCFFLAFIAPVGKLILMPSQIVFDAKQDLLFSAALSYLLQSVIVFLVLLAAKKDKTLFALLRERLGTVGARVALSLLALFLFLAALLPMLEQKLLVQSVFYDTLPSILAFAPFFLFSAYLCFHPIAHLGRMWDILMPFSAVGFAGLIALSAGAADFGALLPVGASGMGAIARGTLHSLSWFFDSALLLPLLGRIEQTKRLPLKGTLCYLAGGGAVLLVLAVFYGVFSDIALRQLFAFSRISKYFPGVAVLGRIDYFFIFALTLVMAFYCAMPLHAGVECLKQAFGDTPVRAGGYTLAVNGVMFTLSVLLNYHFLRTQTFMTHTAAWIFPLFPALLVFVLLIGRKHEKA